MLLAELLRFHDEINHPLALKNNLGDAYLLAHNPIFLQIRRWAHLRRIRFTEGRLRHYDVLPLIELPYLLQQQKIPYSDNVSPLREIEKAVKKVFLVSDLPPLKANSVFHEAAHCVAHAVLKTHWGSLPKKRMNAERDLALRLLFEESFANACESLANVYAARPGSESETSASPHHEFLLKNAYIIENPATRRLFKKCIARFGFSPTFRLVFLSFLHANFLQTEFDEKRFIRSIRLAFRGEDSLPKMNDQELRLLMRTLKSGLTLDLEFTQGTNRFCLKLLGIKTELRQLLDFDFLASFEGKSPAENCLTRLTELVTPS